MVDFAAKSVLLYDAADYGTSLCIEECECAVLEAARCVYPVDKHLLIRISEIDIQRSLCC